MKTAQDLENARQPQNGIISDSVKEYTISELLYKLDPSSSIEPMAESLLLDIADDFIDTITFLSAEAAKLRGDSNVKFEDVEYVVQRKLQSKTAKPGLRINPPSEVHMRRMQAVSQASATAQQSSN